MTDQNEVLRLNVAKQIEEAFADTPYPGDNNIGWGDRDDEREIEQALQGHLWQDLTRDYIYKYRNYVTFLTPEAFRYYLPAFMQATLMHYSEMDTLSSNLIFNLAPPEDEDQDVQEYFSARTINFNYAEQEAILAFLRTFFVLHPQDFEYGEWESVYKELLASAITFWQSKVDPATHS